MYVHQSQIFYLVNFLCFHFIDVQYLNRKIENHYKQVGNKIGVQLNQYEKCSSVRAFTLIIYDGCIVQIKRRIVSKYSNYLKIIF